MNPQRTLRQKLEDLQRAGVTHVPDDVARFASVLIEKYAPATTATTASGTQRASSSTGLVEPGAAGSGRTSPAGRQPSQPASASSRPASSQPGPYRRASPGSRSDTPPGKAAASRSSASTSSQRYLSSSNTDFPKEFSASMSETERRPSNLPREEREAKLKALADRVATCTRCQELAESRTQTVFGVGDPEAEILFIGEAPGADEDRQGEPFVGRAGQLLTKIIEASQLTRDEVFICNILRCRPPGNRTPHPVEAENCREYLDSTIDLVNPKYIVCLGSCAAHNLLDTKVPIGKMRGRFFDYRGIKVLCTYHPSYLLRSPNAKKLVWEDMKFFRADMGVKL